MKALSDFGIDLLIVGDTPRLPIGVGRPIWKRSWSVDLGRALEERRPLDKLEREIAARVGVDVGDVEAVLEERHVGRAAVRLTIPGDDHRP